MSFRDKAPIQFLQVLPQLLDWNVLAIFLMIQVS